MKINVVDKFILVSAAFLKLYVEFLNSGSGNAKRSTAFDVIHRFIVMFVWDMPAC